jgi:hypothetical protein
MATTGASTVRWLGKALGITAALVFAPPDPAVLPWWLAVGLVVGHLLDGLGRKPPATGTEPRSAGPVERACDLLGVTPEAGEQAIRLAYRRRVARCHPDRLPPEAGDAERRAAAERMTALREAMELLLAASVGERRPAG